MVISSRDGPKALSNGCSEVKTVMVTHDTSALAYTNWHDKVGNILSLRY